MMASPSPCRTTFKTAQQLEPQLMSQQQSQVLCQTPLQQQLERQSLLQRTVLVRPMEQVGLAQRCTFQSSQLSTPEDTQLVVKPGEQQRQRLGLQQTRPLLWRPVVPPFHKR